MRTNPVRTEQVGRNWSAIRVPDMNGTMNLSAEAEGL
jgi:hypothetical protein